MRMGTITVAADSPTSPVPTPASTEASIYQRYSICTRSLRWVFRYAIMEREKCPVEEGHI